MPVEAGLWDDFASGIHYQQGDFADPAVVQGARGAAGPGGRRGRHPRQRPVLPRDAALRVPGDRGQPGPGEAQPPAARLVAHRHREAVRARSRVRASAQRHRDVGVRRVAGLPHRPLPGQGHRPQPAGVPLRQRHLRAALEPPLRGPRADHRGRGPGRRGPRRVLRGGRRQPRHPPEPHAPAAVAGRHGAAHRLRGGRPARREGARPAGHRGGVDRGPRARQRGARPVHGRLGRRPQGRRLPRGARGGPSLHGRDVRGAQAGDPELALGGRALLPAHRQAAAPARDGDRGPVQAAAADAVPRLGQRARAQPAGDAHPARRGHPAAVRGQGARSWAWTCAR